MKRIANAQVVAENGAVTAHTSHINHSSKTNFVLSQCNDVIGYSSKIYCNLPRYFPSTTASNRFARLVKMRRTESPLDTIALPALLQFTFLRRTSLRAEIKMETSFCVHACLSRPKWFPYCLIRTTHWYLGPFFEGLVMLHVALFKGFGRRDF